MQAPMRLQIREEGEWVRAYLAFEDSKKERVEIGRIMTAAVDADRTVFEDWQACMAKVMANIYKDAGVNVTGYNFIDPKAKK